MTKLSALLTLCHSSCGKTWIGYTLASMLTQVSINLLVTLCQPHLLVA